MHEDVDHKYPGAPPLLVLPEQDRRGTRGKVQPIASEAVRVLRWMCIRERFRSSDDQTFVFEEIGAIDAARLLKIDAEV